MSHEHAGIAALIRYGAHKGLIGNPHAPSELTSNHLHHLGIPQRSPERNSITPGTFQFFNCVRGCRLSRGTSPGGNHDQRCHIKVHPPQHRALFAIITKRTKKKRVISGMQLSSASTQF